MTATHDQVYYGCLQACPRPPFHPPAQHTHTLPPPSPLPPPPSLQLHHCSFPPSVCGSALLLKHRCSPVQPLHYVQCHSPCDAVPFPFAAACPCSSSPVPPQYRGALTTVITNRQQRCSSCSFSPTNPFSHVSHSPLCCLQGRHPLLFDSILRQHFHIHISMLQVQR